MSDQIPEMNRIPPELQEDPTEQIKDSEFLKHLKETLTGSFAAATDAIKDAGNSLKENVKNATDELGHGLGDTLFGPLALVTKPLLGLSGGDLFDKLKGSFSVFHKRLIPKKEQLLRDGGATGAAAVYLANEISGKDGEEGRMSFLDKVKGALFGGLGATGIAGMAAKLFPTLMKALPIAAIAGGLIWGVVDGIKAIGEADKWGVTKAQAFIGGFLAGTGSGWKNAFANAGKWALIGAGTGMLIGGPVGALIGGLVGAAIGGILGFFGGEKIAKAIAGMGEWITNAWHTVVGAMQNAASAVFNFFKKIWESDFVQNLVGILKDIATTLWNTITAPFKGLIDAIKGIFERISNIWQGPGSVVQKIGASFGEIILAIPRMIIGWFGGLFEGVKTLFTGFFKDTTDPTTGEVKKSIIHKIGDLLKDVGTNLLNIFGNLMTTAWEGVKSFFVNLPRNIVTAIGNIGNFATTVIFPAIRDFFTGVFSSVQTFLNDNPILKGIVDVVTAPIRRIVDTFTAIINEIKNFIADPGAWIREKWQAVTSGISNFFNGMVQGIKDFIADPVGFVKQGLENLADGLKSFINNFTELFKFVGSQGLGGIVKAVSSGDFFGYIKTMGERTALENRLAKLNQNSLLDFANQNKVGMQGTGLLRLGAKEFNQDRFINDLLGNDAVRAAFYEKFGRPENVQDAIIKPSGQIIRTDANDTIIATKSPVDKSVAADSGALTDLMRAQSDDSDRVVQAINTLIEIMKRKDFNNIIQNTIKDNFGIDNLRFSHTYGH